MAGLGKSDLQDVHVGFRPTCTSYLRRRVCGSFSKTDGVSLEVATSILGGLFRRMHPHILGFWFDFLGLSRGMRISGVCAFSAVSRNMIILGLSLRFFHRPPQCLRFFAIPPRAGHQDIRAPPRHHPRQDMQSLNLCLRHVGRSGFQGDSRPNSAGRGFPHMYVHIYTHKCMHACISMYVCR